jgi:hypothetical protein
MDLVSQSRRLCDGRVTLRGEQVQNGGLILWLDHWKAGFLANNKGDCSCVLRVALAKVPRPPTPSCCQARVDFVYSL